MSEGAVSSWMKGRRAPDERDRPLLAALTRELGIPATELAGFALTPDDRIQEFAADYARRFSAIERQIREMRADMLRAAGLQFADARDAAEQGRSVARKEKRAAPLPSKERAEAIAGERLLEGPPSLEPLPIRYSEEPRRRKARGHR
jgi:hypothetical protein